MADSRALALHATLPERYDEFHILASMIDHRGRLVALAIDPSEGVPPPGFWRRPPPRYTATAVICDGPEVREIVLRDLDWWFGEIDTLGDGVVIAAGRCAPAGTEIDRWESVPEEELHLPANVRVFDGGGQQVAAFYAGDAIAQLMTDPQGRIWTSYFDEATYWAPNGDGTRSHHFMVGLIRWDDHGGTPWMAWSHTRDVSWLDCYSLNVGREFVRACPYTEFPLVEIGSGRVDVVTDNPVTRCTGLAVSGSELAFLDLHRDDGAVRWEIRRARREGSSIVETGRERLVLPDGGQPTEWARGKVGRDGSLWVQHGDDQRRWYHYEI
ncbi:hypothetical protein [Nocardia crassostreae]|uniref:hypothetical protein n=1 Tax=Nocardia crassostreae TaxID=53428 RepID=UPI000834DAA9|nr:hypothetical protein [Nocardia crassostreae]